MENHLKHKRKIKQEGWYFERAYLHFDSPISFKKASSIVKNPTKIEKHAFFPFITFNINSFSYTFDPILFKRVKKTKKRKISYSSHLDSHIYSYYAKILSHKYEELLNEKSLGTNVLAFRKLDKKSNIDFAKNAFDDIKNFGECSVIALDFSKFFDTLDHEILKEQWCKILGKARLPKDHYKVYKSLTKYSSVNRDNVYNLFNISLNKPKNHTQTRICTIEDFRDKVRGSNLIVTHPDNKGIPQGSSLSALLSNIYMIDFDETMKHYVNTFGGKYYRYCDDILVISPIEKRDEVEKFAINTIQTLNVEINEDKTEIREFLNVDGQLKSQKPLQYLGFLFDGERIMIRSSSISRYYQKMKKGVWLANKTKQKRNNIRKSKGNPISKNLYKKKLYENYSHLGSSNFITYGLRAKKIMDDSTSIKKQMKKSWISLNKEIEKI